MARISIPEGEGSETMRVWLHRPEMGKAVGRLSQAVYEKSQLPARVREVVRMRIAQINQCPV